MRDRGDVTVPVLTLLAPESAPAGKERRPHALEHLLQSYEEDRRHGDDAGAAISLLAIARIYKNEREYEPGSGTPPRSAASADAGGRKREAISFPSRLPLLKRALISPAPCSHCLFWGARGRGEG